MESIAADASVGVPMPRLGGHGYLLVKHYWHLVTPRTRGIVPRVAIPFTLFPL